MSSELHYLDIILKMEKFTLMSSEFGENCLYFCDFACIFVILPVFLWFCPYICDFASLLCYLVTVRVSVSSCSCWFPHFCWHNVASCMYWFLKTKPEFFSSPYTLFLKTEIYIDINVEIEETLFCKLLNVYPEK